MTRYDKTGDQFTWQHARDLYALIAASTAREIEVEVAGLHVHVVKSQPASTQVVTVPAAAPGPTAPAVQSAVDYPPAAVASVAPHPPAAPPAGTSAEEVEVTAPLAGVFYHAPSPGADPFVAIGGEVKAGETLGVIEVMKLMTTVTAPVDGRLVRVVAANEQAVEFGSVLAVLEPADVA